MKRPRLTELFPFLIPLRQKQRKLFYYTGMDFDGNTYAQTFSNEHLPYEVFKDSASMIDEESKYSQEYQYNKVHNLELAIDTVRGIIIEPHTTFSLSRCLRHADKHQPFKDAFTIVDGELKTTHGGGLCLLCGLLFWLCLHAPLTIVERHPHSSNTCPSPDEVPAGTDATIYEGWLDLKVRNDTDTTYQIDLYMADNLLWGRLLADVEPREDYLIFNRKVEYYRENGVVYEEASVDRVIIDRATKERQYAHLYTNLTIKDYELPADTIIVDR